MNDRDKKPNKDLVWWKPAIEIFSEISVWIVVPMVLALVVGKSLDTHYNTKPLMFLISAGIGFSVTSIGIVKVMKNYTKDLKKIEQEEKEEQEKN